MQWKDEAGDGRMGQGMGAGSTDPVGAQAKSSSRSLGRVGQSGSPS